MDTDALRSFIVIAELSSFSLAAEHLHITQPAISKRIAGLEEALGTTLFDRIGRRITLTEAGRHLLPRARRILQEISDCRRAIRDLSGQVSGTLSIGISHHIGLHRLPPVLKHFAGQYPDVRLQVQFLDSEVAYDMVHSGALELAVVTLAPMPQPMISSITVWPDPLVFVVAGDHPLAVYETLDIRALSEHPAILPGTNTYTGQMVQELFAAHGVALSKTMETNYLETIKMMVSIGLGWSVLPRTMLDRRLRALNISNVRLQRQLGYIVHEARSLSNAATAFIDCLERSGPGSR
jgi:DNA-binding transcriptional LysR family regulator